MAYEDVDGKRTEQIKVLLTERVALDLLRVATADDRKVSDWVFRLIVHALYGHLGRGNGAVSRDNED